MIKKFSSAFFALLLIIFSSLQAEEEGSPLSVQEYYGYVTSAYQNQDWQTLIDTCRIVLFYFKDTPFAQDSQYYLGVGYFYLGDYDFANQELSTYLKEGSSPKFFEDAIYHKYLIAEKFRDGAKKHLMNWEKAPQWLPAKEDAIKIYDEVINTLPYHDLSAKSLFGKARIQTEFEEFRPSIETLQLLIRRFPKHELAVESFLEIGRIYLQQCKTLSLDPDVLDSCEVNLKKFCHAFPGEERWEEAKSTLDELKELFASNLFDTGKFYERTHKKQAALIYYSKVISKFPDSKSAAKSRKRVESLNIASN